MAEQTTALYLSIRNLNKSFGKFKALDNVSLDIMEGEFVCFLGPSGCGKTTLLRCIAGLEEQDDGTIVQNGRDISKLAPAQRDFGIVFQSYALFPNLTASQNVGYGLVNTRTPRPALEKRVHELLTLVGLQDMGHKYPAQLSGGQQQRVALARALALAPGLLLLDEPLSALDARVRASLRIELALLQKRIGVTTIMVTHDQEEALTLADRIVVMEAGVIQQVGTPEDIYRNPKTPFIANFIGEMNFFEAQVIESGHVLLEGHRLRVARLNGTAQGSSVQLAIRPEDIHLPTDAHADNVLPAKLVHQEFLGSFYRLRLAVNALMLTLDLPMLQARQLNLAPEAELSVHLPADHLHIYPQ